MSGSSTGRHSDTVLPPSPTRRPRPDKRLNLGDAPTPHGQQPGGVPPAVVAGKVNRSGDVMTGTLGFTLGVAINEFSSDGTLGGNSDSAVPTEKAVKTYVDGKEPRIPFSVTSCLANVSAAGGALVSGACSTLHSAGARFNIPSGKTFKVLTSTFTAFTGAGTKWDLQAAYLDDSAAEQLVGTAVHSTTATNEEHGGDSGTLAAPLASITRWFTIGVKNKATSDGPIANVATVTFSGYLV